MAYDTKAIEIMIASPSDVIPERQIVRDVIAEWNAINSRTRKICLMPVGWETHSATSMANRAQEIINEQVLKECDLLVGVFWTRVGSATEKSISGSVEEIEIHIAAGKPVMLYFSSVPAIQDNVDKKQIASLRKFKKWAMSKGLVSIFESRDDFRVQLNRQLAITINSNTYLNEAVPELARNFPDLVEVFEDNLHSNGFVPVVSKFEHSDGLGSDAIELLTWASEGNQNTISAFRHLTGTSVVAGVKQFGEGADRRETARWLSAIEELDNAGLIQDVNGKRQLYEMTHEGFLASDKLVQKR